MRTLHTPGVYFEWQDAAPPFIGALRTDVAGFVGIAERGPLHTAAKIESQTQFDAVFGGKIEQAYLAYSIDSFFANGGETCWIVRVADPERAATASLDIVDEYGARLLGIRAGSPGTWGNGIVARWIFRGGHITSLTLHYPDGTEHLVRNPMVAAAPATPNDVTLESESLPTALLFPLIKLDRAEQPASTYNRATVYAGQALLSGGSDGLSTLTAGHFSGDSAPAEAVWGLAALESIREVSVVAMPDILPKLPIQRKLKPPPPYDCRDLNRPVLPPTVKRTPIEFPPSFSDLEMYSLRQSLIGHCEKMRYRVALLDPPDLLLPEQAIAMRNEFDFTDRASLYYPWILVDDPLLLTGLARAIPPSGAVAGIYARSDRQHGVHKPPANEVIEGALDVKFPVDEIVHGELNDANVNVIRSFPGRGIRVYGARTVSNDSLWTYVNVRRLLLTIEKAIEQSCQWMVFEPNINLLRREIDRVIRTYLENLFRAGMLDGADSDAAYFVKCDEALNPPEEADAGRVICKIGVQPPHPAEFVVIVIGKTQDAVQILQEGGAVNA